MSPFLVWPRSRPSLESSALASPCQTRALAQGQLSVCRTCDVCGGRDVGACWPLSSSFPRLTLSGFSVLLRGAGELLFPGGWATRACVTPVVSAKAGPVRPAGMSHRMVTGPLGQCRQPGRLVASICLEPGHPKLGGLHREVLTSI